MSEVLDEKVVSMKFDNAKFQKEIAKTMKSLEQLNSTLQFKGAEKGIEDLNSATKKIDFYSIENAAAKAGFSIRDIWLKVTSTFETNIANRIEAAGRRMVSALTFDQVNVGWTKYEQKTASVQTIMNSTGKSIDEVSKYLDKLMWYSDETSYGFTDMTASLAQLTSAGGDIDKLIPMIEGVANATAFAGKGANEFSRAIYNLNQSYSAGYLQYMDWKSLDMAGISSRQLKETLISTAEELGKIQKGQVTLSNFAETLKDKWADTEVMEKAFGKFAELTEAAYKAVDAGEYENAAEAIAALSSQYDELATKAFKSAQEAKSFTEAIGATKDAVSSGWLKTYEIVFGNYKEATKLWTNLANTLWDVFASGADKRNELLSNSLNKSGWDEWIDQGIMDESGYQEMIARVAKENNIAIDKMIEEYGSLEDAIRKGLSTEEKFSDIMTESLNRLVDVYRNLPEEQLKNLGYTEDQVSALTELNAKIQNGSISVDNLSESIQKMSGRELIIKSISNIFNSLSSVLGAVKKAYREIFPETTSDKLYSLINAFKNFTEKLKLNEEQLDKIRRTFKGLFAIAYTIITVLKVLAKIVFKLIGAFSGVGDGILSVTAYIGDMLVKFRDFVKGGNSFYNILYSMADGIHNFISSLISGIKNLSSTSIFESIKSALNYLVNEFKKAFNAMNEFVKKITLTSVFESIKKALNALVKAFEIAFNTMSKLVSKLGDKLKQITLTKAFATIKKALNSLVNAFKKAFSVISKIAKEISKAFEDITLDSVFTGLLKAISALWNLCKKAFNGIKQLLKPLIDMFKQFKVEGENLLGIAGIGAIIYAVVKLKKVLSTLKNPFSALTGGIGGVLEKIFPPLTNYLKELQNNLKAERIKKIAVAIGLLAISLYALGYMEQEKLEQGIAALTMIIGSLMGLMAVMSKFQNGLVNVNKTTKEFSGLTMNFSALSKPFNDTAQSLIGMSALLLSVAFALSKLSKLSWDELKRGLISIGIVFGILTSVLITMGLMTKKGMLPQDQTLKYLSRLTKQLMIIAVSMKILATMSWEQMGVALTSIAGVLMAFVGVMVAMKYIGHHTTKGGYFRKNDIDMEPLLTLAKMLLMIAIPIKILSTISWEQMGIALFSIVSVFTIMAIVVDYMKKIKIEDATIKMVRKLTSSLLLITIPILILGNMDWGKILQSLKTIALVLGMYVGISAILGLISNVVDGDALSKMAGSLITISIGIMFIVPALLLLSKVPWDSLVTGLLKLSTILAVIGAAAYILSPLSPVLLAIAGSMLMMSAAALLLGPALIGISAGLVALFGAMTMLQAKIAIIASGVSTLIVAIGSALISLIPILMESLGKGLVKLMDVLADSAKELATSTFKMLMKMLDVMTEFLPGIVDKLVTFIIAIVDQLAARLPDIIGSFINFMAKFFDAALVALGNVDMDVILKGILAVGAMAILVHLLASVVPSIPMAMVGLAGVGILIAELAFVIAAIGNLARIPGFTEMLDAGGNILSKLGSAIGKFIGSIIGGFGEGLSDHMPQIGKNLSQFMINLKPFINGIKEFDSSILGKVADLVAVILLISASSFLDSIANFLTFWDEEDTVTKFGRQLGVLGEGIAKFSDYTKNIKKDTITAASEALEILVRTANNVEFDAGKQEIQKLAEALPKVGEGINGFYNNVRGIEADKFKSIVVYSDMLFEIAKRIAGTKLNKDQNESAMSSITSFGAVIGMFGYLTKDIETSRIKDVTEAGLQIVNTVSSIKIPNNISTDSISSLYANLVNYANCIKQFVSNMSKVGNIDLIKNQVNSFNDILNSLTVKSVEKAKNILSEILSLFEVINKAEKNVTLVSGLGIYRMLSVVGIICEAINDLTTITSIKNWISLIDKLNEFIAKLSYLIENEIDVRPVIRPVLDLTDVTDGINKMNSMFSSSSLNAKLLSNVDSISVYMDKNQNGGNSDVVSAIEDLKSTIDGYSRDIYNINGITYNESSDSKIEEAIKILIGAAIKERRV